MRPFFPYYGSKWRTARLYPRPACGLVVEPFAGSAGYATYWTPPRVLLIDADPIVCGVWQYLIRASRRELLALPDVEAGEDVQTLGLPQEAAWLVGFWLNRGSAQPKRTISAYSSRRDRGQLVWGDAVRQRLAHQAQFITHWRVELADYTAAPGGPATWFIDPPYVNKGRHYRMRSIDYPRLAEWVQGREGQVIVCENEGADWLPFRHLADIKAQSGTSDEAMYLDDSVTLGALF